MVSFWFFCQEGFVPPACLDTVEHWAITRFVEHALLPAVNRQVGLRVIMTPVVIRMVRMIFLLYLL